jgi:hypothetical protein
VPAVIWIVALAGIGISRHYTMTAEKTVEYVRIHSLAAKNSDERQVIIDEVADRVNHLTFEGAHLGAATLTPRTICWRARCLSFIDPRTTD